MYRFGAFQVDPRGHELRRDGVRVKIQEQSFIVLLKLLEHPGELVTREELRKTIWPADTFVDFDTGLNKVIKRLREVLGDSAEVPTFIETAPKLGYRFVAPVELSDDQRQAGMDPVRQSHLPIWGKWAVTAAILVVASAGAYLHFRRSDSRTGVSVEIVPLTGMPGSEHDPAFSPDGNQIAFRLSDDRVKGKSGIYTTIVGGEKPLQLTNDPNDCCPVWSPDGRSLAFARNDSGSTTIYMLPALGGTPRKLYSIQENYKEHVGKSQHSSWSPDGRYLAVSIPYTPAPAAPPARQVIALLSLTDSTILPLTSPPPELTDWSPTFSPDGNFIAFIRSSGPGYVDDLYVVAATGGEPRRLTFDKREIGGAPSWTPDSKEIIFPSSRGGLSALLRIAASGGMPKGVEGVGTSAFEPAVAPKNQRLAYRSELFHSNLWMVPLSDAKHAARTSQLLLAIKGLTDIPYFSPDGRKIAYESTQSGYTEIWTMNSDGSNPVQLTFLNGTSGTPRWSYDGRFVAFDYRPADHSEIYLVELSGGPPRLLPTVPGADNIVPSWSHDDKWIYFSSNRGNEPTQVWKVPYPAGGPPVQLTKNGGVSPIESADGFVYYARTFNTDEIWKIPAGGGEETLVMKGTGLSDYANWTLSPGGIHFIRTGRADLPDPTLGDAIFFYEFATRKSFPVIFLEKIILHPAVAPDGKFIIFSQIDQWDQTIMLVNHFR
jgi:Tol biopolymer transport system component/DNA-binding winged helix-turn-helix (wHTH) protein